MRTLILLLTSFLLVSCAKDPSVICEFTSQNTKVSLIDNNEGSIKDPFYFFVVIEQDNSSDAIPLPLVSEEFIDKMLKECNL